MFRIKMNQLKAGSLLWMFIAYPFLFIHAEGASQTNVDDAQGQHSNASIEIAREDSSHQVAALEEQTASDDTEEESEETASDDTEEGGEEQAQTDTQQTSDTPSRHEVSGGSVTKISPQNKQNNNDDDLEKISVVGSRIRRLDLKGPSPVHVVTREDIEKSGYNSLGMMLRDSSLMSFGGDSSYVSVRGMSPTKTLVLLNGKRLPKRGSFYGARAANVNAVPVSAIDRVEILSDGASAVYGSEALNSVINIVTRTDLNGVVASTKMSVTGPVGGDTLNTSLTYGKTFPKGYFNTSLEYIYVSTLFYRSLDYMSPTLLSRTLFSDNYSAKSIEEKNTPFSSCVSRDKSRGGACTQDHSDIDRNGPSSVISNFSELNYKITSGLNLKADVVGRISQGSSYHPASLKLDVDEGEILPLSWERQFRKRQAGEKLTFTHRLKGLEIVRLNQNYLLGSNIGVEGEWGNDDWMWSLTNHVAFTRDANTMQNVALIDKSKQAINKGQHLPFEGVTNTTGMLHNADSYVDSLVDTVDLSTDGSLFQGDDLSVSMAMGLQFGHHFYRDVSDEQAMNGNLSGLRGVEGSASRSQQSVYAELGTLYSDWLEIQLAARYDNYSDFGSTVNPKLAMRTQLAPWLVFRGSVGTGFKAPELPDVHTGKASAYTSLIDYKQCNKRTKEIEDLNSKAEKDGSQKIDPAKDSNKKEYCNYQFYQLDVVSNPDLKEETSLSYNLGFAIEPSPNIHIGADYWNYRVENLISEDIGPILKLEADHGINPQEYGVEVIRDKDGSVDIDQIITSSQNRGLMEVNGFDIQMGVDLGRNTLNMDYSHVLTHRSLLFKKYSSELGQYGVPRYRYTLTWDYSLPGDDYSLQLKRRTVSGYKMVDRVNRIPEHSQYDVFFKWNRAPLNGDLTLGAINIFNRRPKFDMGNDVYVDTTLHRGFTTYYVGYKSRF